MRTRTKVWLIIAASLVLIGGILFAGVMSKLKWDFTKLSTVRYEDNTYEINDAFDGISVNTDTADIAFALSDDGNCRVECHEDEKARHRVAVENGALVIELVSDRNWYDYIGISLGSPKITVYLPNAEYAGLLVDGDTCDVKIPDDLSFKDVDISVSTGDVDLRASECESVKIKTSTGDICVKNTSAASLDLTVSTGRVTVSGVNCEGGITIGVSTGKAKLSDIRCKSLTSSGDTGDISLNGVIAEGNLSIERSTGDVRLDASDASEIRIVTDTGDVLGSLLTDKVFITQTDTGRVSVPKTVSGGKCEITTDTGDIKIEIEK